MPNDPNDTMSVFWPTSEKADRIPDTPDLSEEYCPVCEPVIEMDRIVRPVLCFKHQDQHTPRGAADEQVAMGGYLSGTNESEGHSNRLMANLLEGRTDETEAPNLQTPEET